MYKFEDVNVLVTGATGFLGSWLTEKLLEEKANVSVFVRDNSPRKKCIEHMESDIKIINGDLKDRNSVNKAIENQDIVFHLGAVTQVIYSIKNPNETFKVNVDGTLNVLECIRKQKNETSLVYMSTDKVYGEPNKLPIEEDNLLSAKSPYDASKLAADRMCYSYHKTYGMNISIARSSNIYGGREANELRAVPDFIRSVMKSDPPVVRGNGMHERDFIFIDDIVKGLLLLAKRGKKSSGEVFNFGTGTPMSIYNLAKTIIEISNNDKKIEPRILGKPAPGEIDTQYISFKKAKEVLGWKPEMTLLKGLRITYNWYKENQWIEDVIKQTSRDYCIEKIN